MKPAKTAGTSILRHGLEKRVPDIIHLDDHPQKFNRWIEAITDEMLCEYFIFSVIRNPYARMVSAAAYFGYLPIRLKISVLRLRFRRFLKNLDRDRKGSDTLHTHTLPLHLYTHLDVRRPRGSRQFVDFICSTETLQRDMEYVFKQLGLKNEKVAFTNKSKHRPYTSYYDDDSKSRVHSIYKKDIELYGYSFDGRRVTPAS